MCMKQKCFFNIITLLVSLVLLFGHSSLYSQSKPKVALVLSGGGAKGNAHIPVLEALDSLNIVPDLIIGTSMGSIMGGLYAMGYSGDSLSTLLQGVDWNKLLSSELSLLNVSAEEKSEFKRYLVDLDLLEGKPTISNALINDQNLREYFTLLTFPSYRIQNFDSLPIPYRAIAVDIVNGKEVVIDDGSLYMAMRASMAIPSIFTPVEYKNTLLIDGGVLNNFATDIADSLGADIIIGSDVGGGMVGKEELESAVDLLFQTSMLSSNLKNPANRALCDVLIDHVPNISYSSGDFSKSTEIYNSGKIATRESISALAKLAEQLQQYPQRAHGFPEFNEQYIIDTIAYTGIDKDNIKLLKSRINLSPGVPYSVHNLLDGVDLAMGTNLLNEMSYKTFQHDDKIGLELKGKERAPLRFKTSLHYDVDRSIGVLVNVTSRNVIGKHSRTLATLDIAEQPRIRLQHQKYFGKKFKWWWRSELLGERLKQSIYVSGSKADDFRYQYAQFDNQISKLLSNHNSYIGLGLNYENTRSKPIVDPTISDNVISLERYSFHNLELYLRYLLNRHNRPYYPTSGTFLSATVGHSLVPHAEVDFSQDSLGRIDGNTEIFTKLNVSYDRRITLNKRMTGVVQASSGFTFVHAGSADVSFLEYGFGASYYLGGNVLRPRKDNFIFRGLNEAELFVSQFMMLNLGVQINPFSTVYLTPHFNITSLSYDNFDSYIQDLFNSKGNWSEAVGTSRAISLGITASYMSLLGPIDFDVSWVNDINKLRVFFGIGYQFNRSN